MASKNLYKNILIAYSICLSLVALLVVVVFVFFKNDKPPVVAEAAKVPSEVGLLSNSGTSSREVAPITKSENKASSTKTTQETALNKTDSASKVSAPKVSANKTASGKKQKEVVPNKSLPLKPKYKLYFVLDDCGGDLVNLEKFLSIPIEITYAVIPFLPHSTQSANMIHKRGREIIVHQPMEPEGSANPGEGAIFTWMNKDAIFKRLVDSCNAIPYAVGMNNHMGSKATADTNVMSAVLDFIASKGMFFLDSKTTVDVVGHNLASRYNCPYVVRNAMFVDNEKDRASIESAISSSLEKAKREGHAVMIGHVLTSELADALLEMYPDIIDEGYEFDRLSDYFTKDDEELE